MISKELLKKYKMETFETYKENFPLAENENILLEAYYLNFLNATDYLAMKLAEGLIAREDKKAEFDARDFARAEINRLQK